MKRFYKTTTFTILILMMSLALFPIKNVTASSKKVTLTYNAGKGYFKAKSNRGKKKIVIKNKKNSKRAYAPAVRRKGYTFNGWYTKKKGGKKYTYNTKVSKSKKLYPHWLKKYKINDNYLKLLGLTDISLTGFEAYSGKLTTIKQNTKDYPFNVVCKNPLNDSLNFDYYYNLDLDPVGYKYYIYDITCKAKNIINIKKKISMKTFLKKLGVSRYNFDAKNHTLNFACGTSVFVDPDSVDNGEIEEVEWNVYLTKKNKITPNSKVILSTTDEWELY